MFNSVFGYWKTSLFGALSGILTFLLLGEGVQIPTTKQGWLALLLAAAQAAWGGMQKDGSTGSKAV